MASLLKITLVALTLMISYQMFQIPIPEGASEPMKLRVLFYVYQQSHYISSLAATLGVSTEAVARRNLLNSVTSLSRTNAEGVKIEETTFDGVPVRIYTPEGAQEDLPGMVYYHGGGWTVGGLDSHHPVTEMFAKNGHMVVMAVNYRLNPEFSVRDGLDDCVRATQHFIRNADKFSVNNKRICVAGDSAGGNYAATVSLYLRDQNFTPMPKIQLLIYPSVQTLDLQLPSYQQNRNGPFLTLYEMMWYKSIIYDKSTAYIRDFMRNTHVPRDVRAKMAAGPLNVALLPPEMLYPPYEAPVYADENKVLWEKVKEKCYDPYLYPLMADDHSDLPEAYVFTAQYDPLRDDGLLYARKLREAGVKVTNYNCPYGWHGMINFPKDLKDSRTVLTNMIEYLEENL